MVTAIRDKDKKVMMIATSLENAYRGLEIGTYKRGLYWVIEENGKKHKFDKYICQRKSREF